MNGLLMALVAVVLLTQAFIDLELAFDVGAKHVNAPVADFAGLALVLCLPLLWRGRPAAPAPRVAAAWLAAALLSLALLDPATAHMERASSGWWLVRKPVFMYCAYAVALPAALHRLDADRVRHLCLAALALVATVSIGTSLVRISSGWGTWWSAVEHLTPNHKTLAVWAAPWFPWLWWARKRRSGQVVGGLVVAAIVLSGSKAAAIVLALGLAWGLHWRGRPLVARTKLTVAAVALAAALAFAAPMLLGSRTMMDAARSRSSLNKRAWVMLQARPISGMGPGSSTSVEMTEFPHYRINGVEAHGVLQKVGGETGALGLAAWGAFTGTLLWGMRRRWSGDTTDEGWSRIGVAVCLHVSLLTSTEAFTMTHWIPLGVAWAELHREPSK